MSACQARVCVRPCWLWHCLLLHAARLERVTAEAPCSVRSLRTVPPTSWIGMSPL